VKTILFATTALFGMAAIATAGPLPAREVASSGHPLDANQRFLCTYGFSLYTKTWWVSSAHVSKAHKWERAAVPLIGKGRTVNEITVANAPPSSSWSSGTGVAVALYSGFRPYHRLANGLIERVETCSAVKVSILPTKLLKGKKYWIVEKAVTPGVG